jgi:TolB-like protein
MPGDCVHTAETFPRDEILSHLDRVLASAALRRCPKLRDILAFIVRETLEGRGSRINETMIALDVYGRDAYHDSSRQSIIRTAIGRLRSKLEIYYRNAAADDDIRIEIPRGEYQAVFHRRRESGQAEVCAVLPFRDFRGGEPYSQLADSVTDELIHALGRVQGLKVVARTSAFAFRDAAVDAVEIARRLGASRIVEGSVRRWHRLQPVNRVSSGTELTVRLIDGRDGVQLWSGRFSGTVRELAGVQKRMARAVAAAVRRSGS